MALAGYLLGLGASGLAPWGLWLMGHEHLSGLGQPGGPSDGADGACGWVTGRVGLWDVLATWVWGRQLQPLGSWAPNLHVRLRHQMRLNILI